jgi:hypothetical protein
MTISELEEAATIVTSQKIWKEPSIKLRLSTLSKICGNLITFDEFDSVISLAHHTVHLFLQSCFNIPSIASFHFQPWEADHYLGEICITYLNFADFEKSLTTASDTRNLQYMSRHPVGLVAHILPGFKKIPVGLLNWSERLRHPLGLNIEDNLRATMGSKSLAIDPRFQLLEYCRVNWYHHCLYYTPDNKWPFSTLQKLVLERQLPFNWRPWDPPDDLDPFPLWAMFNWAVRQAHSPILQIWRGNVSDSDAAGSWRQLWSHDGERLLLTACTTANQELINILLANRITVTDSGYSSIRLKELLSAAAVEAASLGHVNVVERLLEEDVNVNNAPTGSEKTALRAAAGGGHLAVVERLLRHGVEVNSLNDNERTALQAAAGSGHLAVVERLLQEKAEVNAVAPNDYRTALSVAVEGGHLAVVERLRAVGAK